MIKPSSYWALHKEADAVTLGRVGLALAGREGELSPPLAHAEKLIVAMIRQDSEWMDESIERKKKKVAEAVKRHREKKKAENANEDVNDVIITPITSITPDCNECNVPSLHPSSLPSSILSKESESIETHTRTRGDVPDLKTVLTTATTVMGVPESYARWWYAEMTARDWTNSHGSMIGNRNWRSILKSWHNKATPEELAKIENEAKAAAKSEPKVTAQDWVLCAERCANYRLGFKCAAGCQIPPTKAANPHPPEECSRYTAANTAESGDV